MGEIAKHLRTIHFAIIAICILILIPKIGLRPNRVETAFKQLQSIKEIQKTWPLWTKRFALEQLTWIKNSAIYRFKGEPEHGYIASAELDAANIRHSPNQGLQLRLNGAPIYFYLNVRGSTRPLILAKPQGKLDVADTFPSEISFPGDDSGSKAFVTLQDFTHFWEAALQPRASYLVGISPISYLVRGNTVVAELQTTQDIRPGGGMTLTSRQLGGCEDNEGINSISRRVSKDGYNELFCGSLDDGFLVFPVKKREPRVESNLQKWLIQQFNIGTFSGSKFSEAFPELDRITKGYQELAIDKVGTDSGRRT